MRGGNRSRVSIYERMRLCQYERSRIPLQWTSNRVDTNPRAGHVLKDDGGKRSRIFRHPTLRLAGSVNRLRRAWAPARNGQTFSEFSTTCDRLGEDLTLNLADLEPARVHLFSYPATPQNQLEFFVERGPGVGVAVASASCRRCYRSGHYQQAGQHLCGYCNEPMERLSTGQMSGAEKYCKLIPIAFEKSGNQLVVRGSAVRETFARWYAPVLAQGAQQAR